MLLMLIGLGAKAQTWHNFNAFGLQRKIVGSDTTWRFVGSGSNGFRSFSPNGGGGGSADSTVFRTVANSYSLSGMQTKLNNYVLNTRSITAGFGLLGGGNLTTDRVVYGDTTVLRSVSNSLTKAQVQTALNTKQGALTLTTTGSTGNATLVGNTLNIPNYTPSGGVPVMGTQTYTINASGNIAVPVTIGSTQANTNYRVLITNFTNAASPGPSYVIVNTIVNTSTTVFTVNLADAGYVSGSYSASFNWLLLPSDWIGGGGGGGSGTVTSVGLTSTDFSISGSPVTTSGNITANLMNGAVTYAKMQNIASGTLIGRGATGSGVPTAITIGTGLSLSTSGVLSNTGSGGGTIGYNSGDIVARIGTSPNLGIAWDSGSNNSIMANSTTRIFKYDAGTSTFGGHEFYTSSGNLRLKIATNGDLTLPPLASGSTTPTPSGTEHMMTIDANGLVGHRTIPSGGGGSNLALGTTTSTTQPITNSNGTGFTLPSSTTSLAGLQSAADKTKLDGLPTITSIGTGLLLSSGVLSSTGSDLALGTRTPTTIPITNTNGTGLTLPVATTNLAGALSATDKLKLDELMSGQYTPTLANITNTSSLSGSANYIKVGNVCTVDLPVSLTSAIPGVTEFSITVPLVTTTISSVSGVAIPASGTSSGVVSTLSSSTVKVFINVVSPSSDVFHVRFTYKID